MSWPGRGLRSKQQEIQLGIGSEQLGTWEGPPASAALQASAAHLQAKTGNYGRWWGYLPEPPFPSPLLFLEQSLLSGLLS